MSKTFLDYFLKAKYSRRYKKPNGEWGYIYDFPEKKRLPTIDNIINDLKQQWENKDFNTKLNILDKVIENRAKNVNKTKEQYIQTLEFHKFLHIISLEAKKIYKKKPSGYQRKMEKQKIEDKIRRKIYDFRY